jgi:DNA-binding Lrp family transcriptional regulator
VAALDHQIGRSDDPAVGCRDYRRVVARPEQDGRPGAEPCGDPPDQGELAFIGNRDDEPPLQSDTVCLPAQSSLQRSLWFGAPMTVQAYILIQTEVGKAASVAAEIATLKGVTMAEDVTGPYDVIVRSEARSVDELGKLVVAKVQAVPGITRTLTCPVVHL